MPSFAAAHALVGTAAPEVAILDLLPGPLLVSVDGAMVYANPAALEVFGVDDLAALRDREARRAHVFPEDIPRIEARLAAVARGEQVERSVEYRIVRPDGTCRVVLWTTLRTTLAGRPAMVYAVDDITALASTRDALAASEAHQRHVLAALAEGVVAVDRAGRCTHANPAAATLLRVHAAQLVGTPVDDLPLVDAQGSSIARHAHPVWRALDSGQPTRSTLVNLGCADSMRKIRLSVIPIEGELSGEPIGAVLTFDDVTGEFERNEQTARSEERFRNLAAISPVAIFETDEWGSCSYVNDRWCEFTGLEADRAMGWGWRDALHPDDLERFLEAWSRSLATGERLAIEFRYRRPDGSVVPVHAEAQAICEPNGRITGWIGTATDLSAEIELRDDLRANESRFRELAHRDPVTGLLNRRALMDALEARLASRCDTAVLFLDLDDFKLVNDTYGHDAGDEILCVFAERLRSTVREHDIVARLAGDEFVVVAGCQQADRVARRLLDELTVPISLQDGGRATVGVSIGLARVDPARIDGGAELWLQRADHAMYEAKRRGKRQLVTVEA
jgi:diguanylate cyclase (GGDEF)-like protein/PAS domain S-box-containing protein